MNNDIKSPSGAGGKILCIGEARGAPTNVAAAISALGGQAELAAKVGADPFGNHLIDVMRDFGVSTKWVIQDPKHFTSFAFVSLMENGERDFYFNRGADGQLTEEEINSIDLSEYAIIHFGSATGFLPGPLKTAYKSLLLKTFEKDIFVSFDPNYRQLLFKNDAASFIEQSWYFIKHCHFFKVSDEEALLLTGASTVEEAAKLFSEKTIAVFAITLGKEGTLLGFNNQTIIIESIPVKPVDTTGAGDAFVGAVLYQLSDKDLTAIKELSLNDWKQIIGNANKAGARTCEYLGAMEAFKHLNNQIFQ